MPQLQGIGIPFYRCKPACLASKSFTVGSAGRLRKELRRIIRKIFPDHCRCKGRILQPAQGFYIHLRKACGNKQSALIGQTLCDRLRRGHFAVVVSGTEELHIVAPFSPQDAHNTSLCCCGRGSPLPVHFPPGAPLPTLCREKHPL